MEIKMKMLLVNPHLYTYNGFHNGHKYPTALYNMGTHYKENGWGVDVCDLRPEIAFSSRRRLDGQIVYYDDIEIITRPDITRPCGNFDSEHLVKGVIRTGFPLSVLGEKLDAKQYDFITISACGSKTDVTSTSWIYVFMGVYECVDMCRKKQPNAKIQIVGEYAELYPDVAKASGADYVKEVSPSINFIHTDIDLFERETPYRMDISTSMGCANKCAFCFVPVIEGPKRIERPVDDVLNQIENLVDRGITKLRFVDSNLLQNWDTHLKLILQGIIDRNLSVDLTSYGGVEPVQFYEEHAVLMKEAGFNGVMVPLDRTNPKILEKWGGKKSVEEWIRAVNVSMDVFGAVDSYIMIGVPGQTYDGLLETIQICKKEGANPGTLPFTPLAGTCYEDNIIHPELQHPLLWPYANENLLVVQLETLLSMNSRSITSNKSWYDGDAINAEVATRRTIYRSSQAIPISIT